MVGPEAKQKDTRYPYPYLYRAVQWALDTAGQGRAGQVRTPTSLPPAPLPPGPGLAPMSAFGVGGLPGGPRAARAAQVARSLDCCWRGTRGPEDQRGGVEGVEAIDGTEQGTFAREGCPALGHAWPLPSPPNNARKRIPLAGPPSHPLSRHSLPLSVALWGPPGPLCELQRGAQGCGSWAGLWAVDAHKLQAAYQNRPSHLAECGLTAAYGAYPTWAVTSTPSRPSRVALAKVPFWTGPGAPGE